MEKYTARDFFNAIINGSVTDTEVSYAKDAIAKLDARNDKRKNTMSKEQMANEPIKRAILEHLKGGAKVASEIGALCEISTQKASALCGQLVADGSVTVADVKVKGKGTVKQYAVVGE